MKIVTTSRPAMSDLSTRLDEMPRHILNRWTWGGVVLFTIALWSAIIYWLC